MYEGYLIKLNIVNYDFINFFRKDVMKFYFFILALLLAFALRMTAQNANSVVGKWKTADGKGVIQIYKTSDGTYQGKIIKATPKPGKNANELVDENNPNPSLRNRPVIGLCILRNFRFDGEEEWEDGLIYDPDNGKEYSCKMWIEDENTLKIRGYIGISLFGRTEIWTRIE